MTYRIRKLDLMIWSLFFTIGFTLASIGVQEIYIEKLNYILENSVNCHNFLMENYFNTTIEK